MVQAAAETASEAATAAAGETVRQHTSSSVTRRCEALCRRLHVECLIKPDDRYASRHPDFVVPPAKNVPPFTSGCWLEVAPGIGSESPETCAMPPVTLTPLVTFTSPPAKTLNDSRVMVLPSGRSSPATDSPPAPVTSTLAPVDTRKTPVLEIASKSVLSVAESAISAMPPVSWRRWRPSRHRQRDAERSVPTRCRVTNRRRRTARRHPSR